MRQKPRFAQHERAHRLEILDGGFTSERIQRLSRGSVAKFRLVAECEKRLRATGRRSGASDGKHIAGGKIGGLPCAWSFGESAIVADVSTKMGEGYEYLAGIREVTAMPLIAQPSRCRDQLRERSLFKPDKKRVIARIAHPNNLVRLFGTIRVTLEADDE
jgi:hypothetical protein